MVDSGFKSRPRIILVLSDTPDDAFKDMAEHYLKSLQRENPKSFDSLYKEILKWKSEKEPSEFPDLLNKFAEDLIYPENWDVKMIALALRQFFIKTHKENGEPFTLQIDGNKIENELDKFIEMLVEAADLVKNQEEAKKQQSTVNHIINTLKSLLRHL